MMQVAAAPSLWTQFPLTCAVLRNTSKGKRKKVAAFKAFLRSNQARHFCNLFLPRTQTRISSSDSTWTR